MDVLILVNSVIPTVMTSKLQRINLVGSKY